MSRLIKNVRLKLPVPAILLVLQKVEAENLPNHLNNFIKAGPKPAFFINKF
jgi:hypothetical protein